MHLGSMGGCVCEGEQRDTTYIADSHYEISPPFPGWGVSRSSYRVTNKHNKHTDQLCYPYQKYDAARRAAGTGMMQHQEHNHNDIIFSCNDGDVIMCSCAAWIVQTRNQCMDVTEPLPRTLSTKDGGKVSNCRGIPKIFFY